MRRKILLIVFFFIILAGVGIVCGIRWNAWFGNQPEKDYVVLLRPHNIVLTYGEDATADRVISWRADTLLQESFVTLLNEQGDTLNVPAEGEVVESRAGRAAFYKTCLHALPEGCYTYRCQSGFCTSEWRSFCVHADEGGQFLLFGDVQDKTGKSSTDLFSQAFEQQPDIDYAAFVGDIIERPTDNYWQLWFRSMQNRQERIPVVAATGNHEYLKGVIKKLDSRWAHVFVNPQNGPYRFTGTSYFVDFPLYRLVVIDTDALHRFSDYTITQTWLDKTLTQAQQPWKIVIMHHPVYAAGKGRNNPSIWLAFRRTLKKADLVFAGHDHNYMRRGEKPVYILTNSSDKFYVAKKKIKADKFASGTRFYEKVSVTADSIGVFTYQAETDSLFDQITISSPATE